VTREQLARLVAECEALEREGNVSGNTAALFGDLLRELGSIAALRSEVLLLKERVYQLEGRVMGCR
jgi:hypothetical protein